MTKHNLTELHKATDRVMSLLRRIQAAGPESPEHLLRAHQAAVMHRARVARRDTPSPA
jgi:hypothetical protein